MPALIIVIYPISFGLKRVSGPLFEKILGSIRALICCVRNYPEFVGIAGAAIWEYETANSKKKIGTRKVKSELHSTNIFDAIAKKFDAHYAPTAV